MKTSFSLKFQFYSQGKQENIILQNHFLFSVTEMELKPVCNCIAIPWLAHQRPTLLYCVQVIGRMNFVCITWGKVNESSAVKRKWEWIGPKRKLYTKFSVKGNVETLEIINMCFKYISLLRCLVFCYIGFYYQDCFLFIVLFDDLMIWLFFYFMLFIKIVLMNFFCISQSCWICWGGIWIELWLKDYIKMRIIS